MPGTIPTFPPFDESQERWSSYVERLKQFFTLHDIADAKQSAAILSFMGASTYARLLGEMPQPAGKPYKAIVETFTKILETESEKWLSRIEALHCAFSATGLEAALIEQLIAGTRDISIQKQLLYESKSFKTVEDVASMATALEAASKATASINTKDVHFVRPGLSSSQFKKRENLKNKPKKNLGQQLRQQNTQA